MEKKLWNKCVNCWSWLGETTKAECPKCGGKVRKVCTSCGKFDYDCKCIG